MKYLLIDVGSTAVKYGVYDAILQMAVHPKRIPFPSKIEFGQSLMHMVDVSMIEKILWEILSHAKSVQRIILSVQMHGYILADSNGNAISPYISWQDKRSLIQHENSTFFELFKQRYPAIINVNSGTVIKPNLALCSLFANRHLFPDMMENTHTLYSLGSYLAYKLTGRNATHITDAAALGFYNAQTGKMNDKVPVAFQIPEAELAADKPIGLWNDAEIYPAFGDHQVTFLGTDIDENTYLLNIGTAAQISVLHNAYDCNSCECRPYFGSAVLCTVSGLIGGKEIRQAMESGDDMSQLKDKMIRCYKEGLQKLPPKAKLAVTGGAVIHYNELIKDTCRQLDIEFEIRQETDALNGLIKLAKHIDGGAL